MVWPPSGRDQWQGAAGVSAGGLAFDEIFRLCVARSESFRHFLRDFLAVCVYAAVAYAVVPDTNYEEVFHFYFPLFSAAVRLWYCR
jgi:hypothetical protein